MTDGQTVSANLNLCEIPLTDNIAMEWNSSRPEIISSGGRYNPTGLTDNVDVELCMHIASGNYHLEKAYMVEAKKETFPTSDWASGMVAYYNFDNTVPTNSMNPTEQASLLKNGSNQAPILDTDDIRNGSYAHLTFGASGHESYISLPNPFYKGDVATGVTLTFWLKRDDNNLWDALFAFYNTTDNSRFYMAGGSYMGYNSGKGNWIDINYPTAYTEEPIGTGRWHLVTVTISRSQGVKLYVDGTPVDSYTYAGNLNGAEISKGSSFDYDLIVDHIVNCPKLTLGYGSFWGSPNVNIDDLVLHNRILSRSEINGLKQMLNRVYDIGLSTGINTPHRALPAEPALYDLSGRHIGHPQGGVYIQEGKKRVMQ